MVHSLQGLFFTVPEIDGFVGGGFIIVIPAIIGVAARDPDTSQSPGIFQGSLDGVDELLMVSAFPQFHQGLLAAWPGLFADIAVLEGFLVHD